MKPGGTIVCDDADWGSVQRGVARFIEGHEGTSATRRRDVNKFIIKVAAAQ